MLQPYNYDERWPCPMLNQNSVSPLLSHEYRENSLSHHWQPSKGHWFCLVTSTPMRNTWFWFHFLSINCVYALIAQRLVSDSVYQWCQSPHVWSALNWFSVPDPVLTKSTVSPSFLSSRLSAHRKNRSHTTASHRTGAKQCLVCRDHRKRWSGTCVSIGGDSTGVDSSVDSIIRWYVCSFLILKKCNQLKTYRPTSSSFRITDEG